MKFNSNYILRDIAGESLLVRQGHDGVDMTRVVVLNASGAYLYSKFFNSDFNESDLVNALCEKYDINQELAIKDARNWIKTLKNYDAITR